MPSIDATERNENRRPSGDRRMEHLERRLTEAFDRLWDDFVDPAEAMFDGDGSAWRRLCVAGGGSPAGMPFADEQQLAQLRDQCRALAVENEFAINGHENRISYIVGSGHVYRATARHAAEADQTLVAEVQTVVDEFIRLNDWSKRQQEIVRRKDRDGECFLRLFPSAGGATRVRFVEPAEVAAPDERRTDPAAAFGVQTDPDDVETVLGYWIGGRLIGADEIQHRKANVDANVRRGLPLFYPVRKNLRRAEKLLRNMSVVAEIQSAIALIRKHRAATAAGLAEFVAGRADLSVSNAATGRTTHFRRFAPGTIIDAGTGTDYEFPAAGIDAARYVAVLQAELRAIASRLVMPEFMLTSDASNANYSSTMVAEGPAVKMFERLQHEMIVEDTELLRRVVLNAAAAGRLPSDALRKVDLRGIPPTLAVRDRLKEAQADQILLRNGALSVATMAMRHGLDPEQERQSIERQTASR
ncbi:MAG: phage portal protein [Pirellulaceae bacterium]|mgnify:CR=1 FL=1|nr:phage portal protein [Pirellulaceae bacterium]